MLTNHQSLLSMDVQLFLKQGLFPQSSLSKGQTLENLTLIVSIFSKLLPTLLSLTPSTTCPPLLTSAARCNNFSATPGAAGQWEYADSVGTRWGRLAKTKVSAPVTPHECR